MKQLLATNGHLKVLAFTLTVVLYFFVLAEKETTREFTVDVTVGRVPAQHVVLNDLPDVTVTISGSTRAFGRLDSEALRKMTIDIVDPTMRRREIREADLGLPRSFTIRSIVPRWVEIDIDELVERELPIHPVVRGTPARGFEARDPIATPPTLTVSAPSSYFPEFEAIFTESIDITGASEPVARSVGLSIQRPFVTMPPETRIEVTVDVVTVVETRTIERVRVLVTGPNASRCAVDLTSVAVTVTGPKTLVDAIEAGDIFASIDCETLAAAGAGVYTPEPVVKNLPRGVTVVEIVPTVLQLTVTRDATAPVEGSGGTSGTRTPSQPE